MISKRPLGRLLILPALLLAGVWLAKSRLAVRAPAVRAEVPERIISLAPSVTETLFALGLGERVVGVTDYCKYPPEAAKRQSVGGYITPNYEAIVALNPDLVVILPEHHEAKKHLAALGLEILEVDHTDAEGIFGSFEAIGLRCGAQDAARDLAQDLLGRIERVKKLTAGKPRPRVMLSLGRDMSHGSIHEAHVASQGTLYDEMIVMAGGRNALVMPGIKYPLVSAEGIIRLDPEVIVELSPGSRLTGKETASWKSVSAVSAVKHGRVHILTQDYLAIPGPRFVLLVEELSRLIHPEMP